MDAIVHIDVPRDVLESARLTPDEARVELAIHLYSARRLGFGKARQLASMSHWQFRQTLASRGINAQYDASDLDEDLDTLNRLAKK